MFFYEYKAIDKSGSIHNGNADAVNVADLEMRLKKMGLDLINYKEIDTRGSSLTGKGVNRRDLITLCFHLEQTSRAGVPILDSLQDLRDSTDNPRLQEVLTAMIELVEGGQTLSEAMQQFPAVFSNVFTNLVKAGEQTGDLSTIFEKLGENLKWQDEQMAHTKKLFIYPIIVGTLVFAAITFLMIFVVPELLLFVKTMGQEVPTHTKVLIAVSNFFVDYWYVVVFLPVILIAIAIVSYKTNDDFQETVDAIQLKLPIIGPIFKKLILTRLTSFFAIMYASGITIIECIRTGEEIAGNKVVSKAMREVGQQIADGATLSNAFESTNLFPPLVLRMIRVGENTGALEESLHNVGYFYSRDVREAIERLQSMVQPMMTLFLGLIVGWIMLSVLGPIYDLITKIDY